MSSTIPDLLSVTRMLPSSLTSTVASTGGVSAKANNVRSCASARSLWKVSGYWSASSPLVMESMPAIRSGVRTTSRERYRSLMGRARYIAAAAARASASTVETSGSTATVGTGPA